jgi:AraC-like DNA-binding protein
MLKFATFQDPPPVLKDFVWYFAVLEDQKEVGGPFNYDLIPLGDTCVTFVVLNWSKGAGGPAGLSFLLTSGPMSKPARLLIHPKQVVLARLKAGAFQSFFGLSPDRVKDKVILLEKFWDETAKILAGRLRNAPDTAARLDAMAEVLSQKAQSCPKPDLYAQAAVQLMWDSDGKMGMEELVRRLGYSERQVERKYLEGLGLTPKEYQRVLRCRLITLRILNGDFQDWTQLAAEYRFADQAHMIREFKGFMGITPEKFRRKYSLQGRVLEGPSSGIRDETAMVGYSGGPGEGLPNNFSPLDVETLIRHSGEFTDIVERTGKPRSQTLGDPRRDTTETYSKD